MTQQDKLVLKGLLANCQAQISNARALAGAPVLVATPQGAFPVPIYSQLNGILAALDAVAGLLEKTIDKT